LAIVRHVLAAAACAFFAAASFPLQAQLLADPVAVPAQPLPFERVNVRLVVDDCVFNPDSVRLTSEQGVTQIAMTWRACLVAGPTKVVDIEVGAFAAGTQRVNVVVNPPVGLGPSRVWTVTFNVVALPEPAIAIFPPPAKPLTNYTGMWWSPRESGWGLSLVQSATAQVFVAWYVYDANTQPVWYTIQMGRWTDFRTWTGTVYRTVGPPLGAAFDPALVLLAPLGTATFSFDQSPAAVDTASFAYTVGGITATKTISRMRF
jgi:hypothetical protein